MPANQAYLRQQPTPLSIPILAPPSEGQPLTSATYIPSSETFGPGVGIPPLYENYGHSAVTERPRPGATTWDSTSSDASYRKEGSIPPTPSRNLPPSLVLGTYNDNMSPGPATATMQNPGPEPTRTTSHKHNASSTSLGGISAGDAAVQWPLERVVSWLARNGFSKDWQETFKSLELQGADFLELGHGSNGRGNLGKMHQVVYPQLAKECQKSGTGWDQARERDEGKRMRKLIRQIQDDGSEVEKVHGSIDTTNGQAPVGKSEHEDYSNEAAARQTASGKQSAGGMVARSKAYCIREHRSNVWTRTNHDRITTTK